MLNVRRVIRSLVSLIGVMGLIVFAAPGALAHGGPSGVPPAAVGHHPNQPTLPASASSAPAHQIYTSPQPTSNADFSGHGANVHGPYDSTRSGAPALNGNGGGAAVGKPCAGCVGKADNKNPPGQLPGGSDPNAGYECDRNHGIGKTNPAHTGCSLIASTPPPSSTPPSTSSVPSSPSTGSSAPSTPVISSSAVGVSAGVSPQSTVAPSPAILGATPVRGSGSTGSLASTGAAIGMAAVLVIALLVVGCGLVSLGRANRHATHRS